MSKKLEYVADFETTSVRVYQTVRMVKKVNGEKKEYYRKRLDPHNSKAWVCAWGIGSVLDAKTSDDIDTGRTIKEFWNYCKKLALDNPKKDVTVFTHNLSFDSDFLLTYLLNTKQAELFDEVRDSKLYSFKLRFKDDKGIERIITFRDSCKIFPGKVAELGALYGIPKLNGDWDYNKYRDETTSISDEEWEYVKHDVLIVCTALRDYRERGYTQNTLAAIAYNVRLQMTYPHYKKEMWSKLKEKDYEEWRKKFPWDITPLPEHLHKIIHKAYLGAITYLNPYWANRLIEVLIYSYDENSMYPDKMRNSILPCGQPRIYTASNKKYRDYIETLYPCIVYHINSISMTLKSSHHIPVAMFPTQRGKAQRCQGKIIACYQQECYLTNIDLHMIEAEYDITELDIGLAYCFKGIKGKYKNFVDYWMNVKANATVELAKDKKEERTDDMLKWTQERTISKKMMNSSYGKDGTKLARERKETYIDENGILDTRSLVEETLIEYYVPDAVFITAYARKDFYTTAKAMGDYFVYGDCDSAKCPIEGKKLLEASGKRIHDTELGAWKMEGKFPKSKFVRQKTYALYDGKDWTYTVCGATEDVKALMDISEFRPGMEITLDMLHHVGKYAFQKRHPKIKRICHNKYRVIEHHKLQGKLIPQRVQGGVILEETGFSLNEVENWDELCGSNIPISQMIDYVDNKAKLWLNRMEATNGNIK